MTGGQEASSPALRAVVLLGGCSGVIVQRGVVLTSAHCLERPIDHVVIAGTIVRIVACEKHPGYQPFQPEHDIGFCRLAAPVPVAFIPVDDGAVLTVGTAVTLAGYGQTSPFGKDPQVLRTVATSIVGIEHDTMLVGSEIHTACRGDSGGPVLIGHDGDFRVAAIIHGPTGAICASAVVATSVEAHLQWLSERALAFAASAPAQEGGGAGVFIGLALFITLAVMIRVAWRIRAGVIGTRPR